MAATLRNSTKPYHLKLFFSNLNTHAQVRREPCDESVVLEKIPAPPPDTRPP